MKEEETGRVRRNPQYRLPGYGEPHTIRFMPDYAASILLFQTPPRHLAAIITE